MIPMHGPNRYSGLCKPIEQSAATLQLFSHDLAYAITCIRVKPMKCITLPFAVKSLTGNIELVHTLNLLGHGVLIVLPF